MSDKVLDLDALLPEPVTVKFGNQEININPPKTGDVLTLGALGQKLQDISSQTPEQIDKLVTDLTEVVYKIVPELSGKPLNTAQLLKLVELISTMAMPPEAEELAKQGITPATDSKKA